MINTSAFDFNALLPLTFVLSPMGRGRERGDYVCIRMKTTRQEDDAL
jgi:hypothetical protein